MKAPVPLMSAAMKPEEEEDELYYHCLHRQFSHTCCLLQVFRCAAGVLRTQDVVVPHQHRLVDLGLPEPAGFLPGEEHLDRHLLSSPAAQPHLAVAALPDLTHHVDLLGDRPLHLEEQQVCQCV